MRHEKFDIQEVIDDLLGTTKSISESIALLYDGMEEDDLNSDDYLAIDNQIFLCEQCGWWCETHEAHENPDGGGDLCDDCNEEKEED